MVTLDLKLLYPKVRTVVEMTDNALERIIVCPMRGALPPLKGFCLRPLSAGILPRSNRARRRSGFPS